MQFVHLQRGQELRTPYRDALVHVQSGVLRVDLVDVQRKLFLHLGLPGDYILLANDIARNEDYCAVALTAGSVQIVDAGSEQFGQAMRALPHLQMRRHAEAMKLRATPTIGKKLELLFNILSAHGGMPIEARSQGAALKQVQIASLLGVAPESVSRALRDRHPHRGPATQTALRMRA